MKIIKYGLRLYEMEIAVRKKGIKWHRVFGTATLVALAVLALMLYNDYGNVIKAALNTGDTQETKTFENESAENVKKQETATNNENKLNVSNKAVVCIDASHGGNDTGQYDGKEYEKTQTLMLAQLVEQYLKESGVKVVMTRTSDINTDFASRIKTSSDSNAVLLVSLHRDIAKKDGTNNGVSAWIHTSAPANSKNLASDIIEKLKEGGLNTKGVNTGTPESSAKDYYLNQHSTSASCILELGNMYSSEDNKMLTTDKEKTAKAISDGIIKYLEQAGYING